MRRDVFLVQLSQQTAAVVVQFKLVSGGRSNAVTSQPLTFRFRSPMKTKHITGHKNETNHLKGEEGKKVSTYANDHAV